MELEPFAVERSQDGILHLKGPLTTASLSSFQNAMRREAARTMILDMSEVPYLDSAGLGSLISTYVSYQKEGRRMVLSGLSPRVEKLFKVTRTESLFLIFPSVWDAVDALTNAAHA
jgi:anti-sigma B factor antagonist